MQQRAMRPAQRRGGPDRLDRPGLVIGQHQADQRRAIREQPGQGIQIRHPVAVHRQHQRVRGGGAHGVMLRRAHDHPAPASQRMDGQRIRLRPAGREHDGFRHCAKLPGDISARILQHPPRRAAGGMDAGRVAHKVHRGQGGGPCLRPQRLRRVGVQVGHVAYSAAVERCMADTRASSASISARSASTLRTSGSSVSSQGVP